MTIHFIDVGQGDAEYIVLPNNKTVLIDGGPSNSNISAFITAQNISTIDYVILTHPHSDHYQGLNYVFDNCQVKHFYDTKMNNSGATGDDSLRNKALVEGCSIYYPSAGDTLNWDNDVAIKVLNACPNTASSSDGTTINNASIVLKLTYESTSILLTGDIDSTVESTLVSTYGNDLSASILKVTHHGSAYGSSTAFLDKVKPTRAYIEVGANNSYGHPDPGTISRLQAAGATVYRTDQSGTLTYTISSAPSGDTTAPSTPSGLSADAISSTAINLTWSASTDNVGVVGYQVFRNSVFISSSTTTSYLDTGLTPSTQYTYDVTAYDAAGNISSHSTSVSATTRKLVKPEDFVEPARLNFGGVSAVKKKIRELKNYKDAQK